MKGTTMSRETKVKESNLQPQSIQKIWQDSRFVFKEITKDQLSEYNLKRISHDATVDCIDERDNENGSIRKSQKLAGASMATLVLRAISEQKSLDEIMKVSIEAGEVFYWHDDDHQHAEGMTGCGANDKKDVILLRFLTKVKGMGEEEATALRDKIIGGKSARDRVDYMTKLAEEKGRPELVVKVSSLTGSHTATSIAVNQQEGVTLVRMAGEKRNFVVDSSDLNQINLALATVDVLSAEGQKVVVLWIG